MRTPPVLQFHLTRAPLLVTEVTGVNAIKDSPGMALTAQVSLFIDPSIVGFYCNADAHRGRSQDFGGDE